MFNVTERDSVTLNKNPEITLNRASEWNELKSAVKEETLSSIIKNNKTKERRERIVHYFVEKSEANDLDGMASEPLETVLKEIQPKEVIDWIRPQKSTIHGRLLAPAQGRYKVRTSTLRDEIAGIKKTFLAVIESFKCKQHRLQSVQIND
ncbi:MAG: hypothetical protein P1V97_00865 [Planctomycetota bacterium]|nr:hypothetical protein [Planctomycetota bacterium]